MKKKTVSLLLLSMLIFSSCGSKNATAPVNNQAATDNTELSSENAESEIQENETSVSDLDALGEIEVDEKIFDVELTIPADYVAGQTQEDLDSLADEYGFKSIILNDDGSATYTMTKQQHKELLSEYREQINNSLNEMVSSGDYPNFTEITANDNFTEFTVKTKSTELDMGESMSVMAFYMYGGLYSVFSGENVDNVSVTFVNAETGDIIDTANSSDMNQ